ncbi:hypothetical protein ACQKDS_04480 [Serratia sp. NPDC078593]|uniref:hypothetical protein n=1 Tax=unclassified Serratia (in: enterobacteria) TaxID=2647522 RepID=UPI0037CFC253
MRLSSEFYPNDAAQQPRLIAAGLFFSGLAAQGGLLAQLFGWEALPYGLSLLLVFTVTFALGAGVMHWRRRGLQAPLAGLCPGFVLNAAGLLLLILMLHAQRDGWALFLAITLSGIGQGIVYYALLHPLGERRKLKPVSVVAYSLLAVFTVVLVLLIEDVMTGRGGRDFALALLVDMALFGALLIRIAQCDLQGEAFNQDN